MTTARRTRLSIATLLPVNCDTARASHVRSHLSKIIRYRATAPQEGFLQGAWPGYPLCAMASRQETCARSAGRYTAAPNAVERGACHVRPPGAGAVQMWKAVRKPCQKPRLA